MLKIISFTFLLLSVLLVSNIVIAQDGRSDHFEDNDTFETAKAFGSLGVGYEIHSFENADDQDWIYFSSDNLFTPESYRNSTNYMPTYSIEAKSEGNSADIVMAFYDSNKKLITTVDDVTGTKGEYELFEFRPTDADAHYYVKLTPYDSHKSDSH